MVGIIMEKNVVINKDFYYIIDNKEEIKEYKFGVSKLNYFAPILIISLTLIVFYLNDFIVMFSFTGFITLIYFIILSRKKIVITNDSIVISDFLKEEILLYKDINYINYIDYTQKDKFYVGTKQIMLSIQTKCDTEHIISLNEFGRKTNNILLSLFKENKKFTKINVL